MLYREPAHKSPRSTAIKVILCIGIPLAIVLAIILTVKYIETENRNREREIALYYMRDILEQADSDGSFTLTDAGQFQNVRLFYDLSYNGEYDDFVSSSIELCSRVISSLYAEYPELNEHIRLVSWQDDFLLCLSTADDKYFFNYDKEYYRVRTNVFLEDYTLLEDIGRLDELCIYTRDFTEEQREQLESTANEYSFEIRTDDRLVIRKNSHL